MLAGNKKNWWGLLLTLGFSYYGVLGNALADDYDPTTLVFPSFMHTMGIRKATKMHLMLYTRNRIKVRDPQGIAVARLDSWDDPESKKDDDEVTGYGVNAGENVIIYNKSMTSLGFYGLNEKGTRKLNHPTAVTANRAGDVYVTDTGNNRIVRFYNSGKKLEFIVGLGGLGSLAGQFNHPQGIAMDSHDRVYVSDTGNHRIQILRPDDQVHAWFGHQGVENGNLWHPTGIAVTNGKEKWSHYKDAFIAVIDLDGGRLQKFALDGRFKTAVKMSDIGYPQAKLMYAAIDYYSNIWVTDIRNHCLHKFDRNLNYLSRFGRHGDDDKEFEEPRGIAIYKRFGQVFVAEKESAQYYWIGTDVSNFTSKRDTVENQIALDFFLTEPSFLTLTVKQPDGTSSDVLSRSRYYSGQNQIHLDSSCKVVYPGHPLAGAGKLQSQNGALLAPGKYSFSLKAEATYSSMNYFSKEVRATLEIE